MNILVTMSGGTTTVINATLVGIIEQAQKKNYKVYVAIPGLLGVFNDNIIDISNINKKSLKMLYNTPSSCVIGTTRIKKMNDDEFNKFKSIIKKYDINYFFNIGGNGTVKQSKFISENIKDLNVISLPKTVDNDLGDEDLKMMHYTPGFPSIVNYWCNKVHMLNNESLGSCSHDKVMVAQTFGRDVGFIAGAARYADRDRKLPLVLLLPEDLKNINLIIDKISNVVSKNDRALVIMSEGYMIMPLKPRHDHSGQIMYSSSENLSAQLLTNVLCKNGIQSRAFIPGVDQRSNDTYTLKSDLKVSYELGKYAVNLSSIGDKDLIVCKPKHGYDTLHYDKFTDLSRCMPKEFISDDFDVTDSYIEYLDSFCKKIKIKEYFRL